MSVSGVHSSGEQGEGVSQEAPFSFEVGEPLENERHERFCQEIVNRRSNVRAYMLAYPDAAYMSAAASSARLIKDGKIRARIDFLKQEFRERFRMTQEDIILGLEMAAQFDPDILLKPDGTMYPIDELPAEIRLCIERIEFKDGVPEKVHAMSKKSAYELLTKIHGMQRELKEVTHKFDLENLLAGEGEE